MKWKLKISKNGEREREREMGTAEVNGGAAMS